MLAVLGAVVAIAGGAVFYMEHNGHWVTGMTNQVVWGIPHVFAIFLIVAASGALNVASIGTAFDKRSTSPLEDCPRCLPSLCWLVDLPYWCWIWDSRVVCS